MTRSRRSHARQGRWALLGIKFPIAMFFVAAPVRLSGPTGFLLRSDCSGYPATAPTSQLWHGRDNQPLAEAHRPKNKQGGTMVSFTQRSTPCLYHPVAGSRGAIGPVSTTNSAGLPTRRSSFCWRPYLAFSILRNIRGASLPAAALKLPQEFVAGNVGAAA